MKIGRLLTTIFFLFIPPQVYADYAKWSKKPEIGFNLAPEVRSCMRKSNYADKYEISGRINPVVLRADMNGDNKMDYLVFIQRVRDKKDGLLVCYQAGKSEILFAGNQVQHNVGKGGQKSEDNLARVDYWYVYQGPLGQGLEGAPPAPTPKGEVILIGRMETWSWALYWTGSKFVTYQLGD